jgi:hydrogenase nickel incorporation protein HypA/HybF
MHELTIIKQVIDVIQERVDDGSLGGRIRRVHLHVGKLSAAVPANLSFLFGVISEGTPLEHASLEITEVPMSYSCKTCHAVFPTDRPVSRCPVCRSRNLVMVAGRELLIDSVEVDP